MKKKETSQLSDSNAETYDSLSPEDKFYVDSMTKQSLELCKLLGICDRCGSNLGYCVHSDYSIN